MEFNTFSDLGYGTSILTIDETICFVDTDMVDILRLYKWRTIKGPITTRIIGHKNGKGRRLYYIHRVIMGAINGTIVDHIDHNPLENRRYNLRICTSQENSRNTTKRTGKTSSQYKGVSWMPRDQKWCARISIKGRRVSLGVFIEEELAAEAYNIAANRFYGEFACINEINDMKTYIITYEHTSGSRQRETSDLKQVSVWIDDLMEDIHVSDSSIVLTTENRKANDNIPQPQNIQTPNH